MSGATRRRGLKRGGLERGGSEAWDKPYATIPRPHPGMQRPRGIAPAGP